MPEHHLKKIRLPLLCGHGLAEARALVAQLGEQVAHTGIWEQLDQLVAQSFGLTPDMHYALRESLRQSHLVRSLLAMPGRSWPRRDRRQQ